MGINLSEIEEGSTIVLQIKNNESKMQMDAMIKKKIRDDVAIIALEYDSEKRLNFDNVLVDMEYYFEGTMPIRWRNVQIVSYKSEYVMQAPAKGERMNRRDCFRVGVGAPANLRMKGHGAQSVLIRDISLSGFAITDRKRELGLQVGDELSILLEDAGFHLGLTGKVVRTEEREDVTIYGLEITNLCKDLSKYINVKQRPKR